MAPVLETIKDSPSLYQSPETATKSSRLVLNWSSNILTVNVFDNVGSDWEVTITVAGPDFSPLRTTLFPCACNCTKLASSTVHITSCATSPGMI